MENANARFLPTLLKTVGAHKLLALVFLCCISFPVFTIGVYYAYQVQRDLTNPALHKLHIERSLHEISDQAELSLAKKNPQITQILSLFITNSSETSLSRITHVELSYTDGTILTSAWAANFDLKRLTEATKISHDLFYKNKHIGQLIAYYEPAALLAGLWPHLKHLIGLFVVQLMIGISVLSIFVYIRVLKPVREVSATLEKIAKGDLSTPVPQGAKYEFDDISRHLEKARQNALGTRKTLEQLDA